MAINKGTVYVSQFQLKKSENFKVMCISFAFIHPAGIYV
jgi:hypothetical protein